MADRKLGLGTGIQDQRLRLTGVVLPSSEILSTDPFDLGKPGCNPALKDLESHRPSGHEQNDPSHQDRQDDDDQEELEPAAHGSPLKKTEGRDPKPDAEYRGIASSPPSPPSLPFPPSPPSPPPIIFPTHPPEGSPLNAESTQARVVHPDGSPSLNPEADIRPELVWRGINAIRALSMDAVEQAQSGHPGTPMALAPAAYLLWTRFLRHNPRNPLWIDRDRFVLSCGHASMLIYSLLHLTGYDLSLEEIKNFRQWGSKTPGHPERGHTPGVETTTGPLGQGFGNAVGMAMAERFLAAQFNRPNHPIVDHRVWAFASDGDLMEGVASEAASLAGHLRLGKLTVVYDDNHITIDGDTALTFSEDVPRRFEAYGWRVLKVADGNDLSAINQAYETARAESSRPTLIALRTVIADPAPTKRNSADAHGAPLGADEVRRTKEILGWPQEPKFHVPDDALEHWRTAVARGAELETGWRKRLAAYAAEF